MKDFLADLNGEQRKAVEAVEGPVMVLAGAGSGKTRALTYRVAHLLGLGVDPFRVLALTFTNKAAREMRTRIVQLIGGDVARNVWMGTFHSIFARILRTEASRIGYPSHFSIYDTDDCKRLIKSIIKEQNLNDKVYAPGWVLSRISGAKTNLITAREYFDNEELRVQDQLAGKPRFAEIYQWYDKRCRKASAMDFDDLLLNMYILLVEYADLLVKYQNRFRYILVDEYQDTNHAQYMILKKLAANDENICVVGDDAQSIYAFRGANIQNILNFKKDYPDARVFKLEQNYRSTRIIVQAANSIIKNNREQIFKEIWTENEEGQRIRVFRAASDTEEGLLVAQSIFEQKMNLQLPNHAFAVLYRTNAQSRALEEALRKLNIPYRIYGGLSFYQRKEIKDILAYFRLAVNIYDEEALLRVINYPTRGIGKTTVEKILVAADEHDVPLFAVMEDCETFRFKPGTAISKSIHDFATMIRSFNAQLKTKNAFELGKHIAGSSGIMKELFNEGTQDGINRFENVEELLNALKDFTERKHDMVPGVSDEQEESATRTLDMFLQEIALVTDADTNLKQDSDTVSLMTVHASKGLEFPHVVIVGLEENLFPNFQSLNTRSELEEERRLFYVATTRAQKSLLLTYAESRYRWGEVIMSEPSRFIDEIDDRFLDHQGAFYRSREKGTTMNSMGRHLNQIAGKPKQKLKKITDRGWESHVADPEMIERIQPGLEIEHQRFGRGKVLSVEGSGINKKAVVFFQTVGQKQLLLRFARLWIPE
ncbi:MAG: UvrD-helicase domain-containing protein [Bacteroidales bacterium]|nr:UvrD-helicase domain-containing protein [Bacteroidales bacterium]